MKEVKIYKHPRFSAVGEHLIEALELLLGTKVKITYMPDKKVWLNQVEAAVIEEFGVDREAILSNWRKGTVVEARQVMMYLMRTLLEMPDKDIAHHFGKDRTCVISSFKRIRDLISVNDPVKDRIENCLTKINSYEPQY